MNIFISSFLKSMPGLGRFPCSSCHFVASNRRMLAKHVVFTHTEKTYKCPLCPFITQYAANWYRHKRGIHGLSKMTTCEICGFFTNSIEDITRHKEVEHPDHLKLEKYKSKQKAKTNLGSKNIETLVPDLSLVKKEIESDSEEKETTSNDIATNKLKTSLKDDLLENTSNLSKPDSTSDFLKTGMNSINFNNGLGNLYPLKVRRSYCCDLCGLLTNNPREYLYHCKDTHGEKINVHECKYCIYASKHVQKLQRHCNLVHRQQLEKVTEIQKHSDIVSHIESKKKTFQSEMLVSPPSEFSKQVSTKLESKPDTRKKTVSNVLKCTACIYQTKNKMLMINHEKTAHLKKKFFKCMQCGYVTNERSRYTKHIKHHSLPKMKCEFCFFKTVYKWNMERHMKNHESGNEGEYTCTLCHFSTSNRQSLKSHVTNHHARISNFSEKDKLSLNDKELSPTHIEWEDMINKFQDNEKMSINHTLSFQSNSFSIDDKSSETFNNSNKNYLKCRNCDFQAIWPFEMKKHEETHKNLKKHPCPLCGMRFEHIAWLTKHLRRVHTENTQARNIAEAFELLKPNRRKPIKEHTNDTMLPIFDDVFKPPPPVSNTSTHENKNSMLSTLLKKPIQPILPSLSNKTSNLFKKNIDKSSSSLMRQSELTAFLQTPNKKEMISLKPKVKSVPTCSVCGYKTRWISELQRHMRVHTQEKPFHCHKCKYHCKWKGDLNRHLNKYHGIKIQPSKKNPISKIKFKKSLDKFDLSNDRQAIKHDFKRNLLSEFSSSGNLEQDSPLDLTLSKTEFTHNFSSQELEKKSDSNLFINSNKDNTHFSINSKHTLSDSQVNDNTHSNEESSSGLIKRRYQCPFCVFSTTTASRFHVHIVQHYNKRPFMCSLCGYNSNWEWDITKHIRLKGYKDKAHNKACVLLTDETGRRNYDKYEKYLVDIEQEQTKPTSSLSKAMEINTNEIQAKQNSQTKDCSYDFKNIGSNFEETPVNIVVTPDINLLDSQEMEKDAFAFYSKHYDLLSDENSEKANDFKFFFCKHCDFKHATKRVVISHLSIHAGLKPFRCRACGLTSNWRHVIVRHVKDTHNGYMNEVEDRITYVQEGYALRLTSISSDKSINVEMENIQKPQFGCKICPYKCDKEFYIKFHMKQHKPREGAIYKCNFCPYFVKFKKTLVRHMKLHNYPQIETVPFEENKLVENSNNYYEINSFLSYDVYEFENPENNDLDEDAIPISFEQLNQPNIEQFPPPKLKRHICDNCPYKTDNKTQYLYHKQFHRPNLSAPFKCSICSYWATMQHLLTQHMKVHSESNTENENDQSYNYENEYLCPYPNQQMYNYENDKKKYEDDLFKKQGKNLKLSDNSKKNKTDENLDDISIIHIKRGDALVKMFKCNFCPMRNKKRANVRVHQRMHGVIVNNGKYACTYCNYQCLNQGGLTNHIKIHQKNEEKETYEECSEITTESTRNTRQNLLENQSHSKNATSYSCMNCPAAFKSASDLLTHKKFHGSSFPYPCSECDFSAKNKPHLLKHISVHSSEYLKNMSASNCFPDENKTINAENTNTKFNATSTQKIDQMLLLESSELKLALGKAKEMANKMHKCVFCPALFFKTSTLAYHLSLHGSDGEFKCSQCDYSTCRSENLSIHSYAHSKKITHPRRNARTFNCSKCPAVFSKQDRYIRHLDLHGKNYKFACDQCDYSVRFAANLFKHKTLHSRENLKTISSHSANASSLSLVSQDKTIETSTQPKPMNENLNFVDIEEKKIYVCDRCPYFQSRKDAVQNHQKRHWLKDGFKCPYCDYSSMQSNFLRDHIKIHIQSNGLFPPQAFIEFKSFQIFCKDSGKEKVLFDDKVSLNRLSNTRGKKLGSSTKFTFTVKNKINDKLQSKHSTATTLEESSSSNSKCIPIVILRDIFDMDNDLTKYASKDKINEIREDLKIAKRTNLLNNSTDNPQAKSTSLIDDIVSTEDETNENSNKPSLVMKIKVNNCFGDNQEKTMYSVSSTSKENIKKSDQVTLNESIAKEDQLVQNSNLELIVYNSKEEKKCLNKCNTTEQNIGDQMDIEVSSVTNEIEFEENVILSQPDNEIYTVITERHFQNDTVPVVIVRDILNENLKNISSIDINNLNSLGHDNAVNPTAKVTLHNVL